VKLPGPIEAAWQEQQETLDQKAKPGVEEPELENPENTGEIPDNQGSQPEPEPAPEPQTQTPAEPAEPAPDDEWKKRFIGYKQSTDETIHQLRTMLATREQERASSSYELEQLRTQIEELRKASPQSFVPQGVLSEEDLATLGPDNAERIAKIAYAQIEQQKKDVDAKLAAVMKKYNDREAVEAQQELIRSNQDYWGRVQNLVKEAPEIDNDPKFSDFLNTVEPNSGKTWRDLGAAAKASWDVSRMADIYKAYQQANAKPTRAGEVTPRGQGAGTAPQQGDQSGRIWTPKEYEQAVFNLMRGGPMTQDKMKKIDAIQVEFQNALRQGRVRR